MILFDQQCIKAIDLILLSEDWGGAHKIVQDIDSPVAQWIHAVLHKIEGDESNSRYWYNQSMLEAYETHNNSQHELQAIKEKILG